MDYKKMICTDCSRLFKQMPTFTKTKYGVQTIDPIYTSLYFNPSKMGKKREVKLEKFKEGDVFSLQGVECDDFTMPIKEYKVVKKVDEIFGVKLDGIVVKQVSGDTSTIFSLTKTDCQTLGVDFEPCLTFFPINMNWKEVKLQERENIREFSPLDISTYPVNQESGLIERIVVKISNVRHGFEPYGFNIGDVEGISARDINGGIYLKVKKPIVTAMGILTPSRVLSGQNITQHLFGRGLEMCDNAIYIEFNVMGINPQIVQGESFGELFDVVTYGTKRMQEESEEIIEKLTKTLSDNFARPKMRYHIPDIYQNQKKNNYQWHWVNYYGGTDEELDDVLW